MRKLLFLILLLPAMAWGQNTTTLPSGTTSTTLQARVLGTDSLRSFYIASGQSYNQWYTATQINKLFRTSGSLFNKHADSLFALAVNLYNSQTIGGNKTFTGAETTINHLTIDAPDLKWNNPQIDTLGTLNRNEPTLVNALIGLRVNQAGTHSNQISAYRFDDLGKLFAAGTAFTNVYKLKSDSTALTGYQTVGNLFGRTDTRYYTKTQDDARFVALTGSTSTGRQNIQLTTEQLRLAYDVSNYASFTVSSAGTLLIAPSNGQINLGTGILFGSDYRNTATSSNSRLQLATTGLIATRNVADANPALLVTQASASSTGNILSLANNVGNVFTVSQAGQITLGTVTTQTSGDNSTKIASTAFVANGFAPLTRTINTTLPLTGGGDLSANRTFGLGGLTAYGSANQILGMNAAATGYEYKTVTAGNGISVTQGTGTVTIAAIGNPIVEISGTSQAASGNTIYIPHNVALTTITVPTTTTIGTLYQIIGEGSGGWKLQLPASAVAVGVGGFTTTSAGSLNSTDRYCTITIRYAATNKFVITTSQGTITPL